MDKPVLTSTWHTLPFEKLSPLDFERLCLWLVRYEGYERVEHLGESGGEKGRDVLAWKDGRRFVFQCKRVQSFTPADARKEIQKLLSLPASEQPHELVFVVSRAVSADARSAAREAWGDEATCHFWVGDELDAMVKSHPKLLKEFFQLPAFDLLFALAARVLAALARWWERKHATELSPEDRIWLVKKVKRRLDDSLKEKLPGGRRLHIRWETPDLVGQPVPKKAFAEVAASELVEPVHEHFLGRGRIQGWSLLILGAPGSGKTIALLELARGLAELADGDPKMPVPVVFHLASWKGKDRSLADWMARELAADYHAGAVAEALIWGRRAEGKKEHTWILPLLDGLDEVEARCRPGCVVAINDYLGNHGLSTIMVVTCHTQVYEQMPVHLQLETAVALRPLERAQIEEYLGADPALAGLRASMASNAGLQELASLPLMLTLLERTYRDAVPEGLPVDPEALEDRVWKDYVTNALKSEPTLPPKGRARARRTLAWLARGMAKHNPALFQVERLQPDYLTSCRQVFAYAVLSRSLGGCLLGLPIALAMVRPELADAPLLAGSPPLAGALVGALETIRLRRTASPAGRRAAILRRWLGWTLLLGGVAFLTVFLLGIPWVAAARTGSPLWHWRISTLVRAGLMLGLGFGGVFGGRGASRGGDRDIRVKEALSWRGWSWRGTVIGASSLLMLSLAFWALLPVSRNESVSYLRGAGIWIPISLTAALLGGLLFGAFGGLRGRSFEEKDWRPNKGTWLALHNAGVVGLRMGLVTMLGLGLVLGALAFAGVIFPRGTLLWFPLKTGLVVGLLAGLAYSGLDFVQHFSLRLVLRLAKLVPGRLVGFLDQIDRGLLQRVGGSYQFYHPNLREWFERYSAEPDRSKRRKRK